MDDTQKIYTCTNCNWTGSVSEMDVSGDEYSCPHCCAIFYPENPSEGPWEELFPGLSGSDFDFDEDEW